MEISDQIKRFLEGCVGAVEANSYETMCLWKDYKDHWEEQNSGYGVVIGECAGMPVALSVMVHKIYGQPVLFYHATSTVVDYNMINEWLKLALPDAETCDANSFHHVAHHAEKLSKVAA